MEDKADLGADLAGEGRVRAPRGELVMIAAEEIGQEKGVGLIMPRHSVVVTTQTPIADG